VNSDVMDYDGYTDWLEMRRAANYCKQNVLLDYFQMMAKKARLKGGRGKTGTRQAHCGIDMCSVVKISWHKIGGCETKLRSSLE
jgi:hypothetical protein